MNILNTVLVTVVDWPLLLGLPLSMLRLDSRLGDFRLEIKSSLPMLELRDGVSFFLFIIMRLGSYHEDHCVCVCVWMKGEKRYDLFVR